MSKIHTQKGKKESLHVRIAILNFCSESEKKYLPLCVYLAYLDLLVVEADFAVFAVERPSLALTVVMAILLRAQHQRVAGLAPDTLVVTVVLVLRLHRHQIHHRHI